MSPVKLLSEPIDERLTLAELAREQQVSPPTTSRWAGRGVAGLKLPTFKLGHKRLTTRGAFTWWVEQLTSMADEKSEPGAVGNPSREQNIERAEQEAARMLGLEAPSPNEP